MKLGPLYALWTKSWLGLMQRLVESGREIERLSALVAEYRRREAEPPTPPPTRAALLRVIDDWITCYDVDGVPGTGYMRVYEDVLLREQLAILGGVAGKRVLELGPMEAAHTRIVCEAGAREVVAVEGFRKCLLKCLVAKEVFQLSTARFLYGDFCEYVDRYEGDRFDLVLARGVLYHQANPAELLRGLGRIADALVVWSQVADETFPTSREVEVVSAGVGYRGKVNDYNGIRDESPKYCGGVHPTAVWLYPDDLRRAVRAAGFPFLYERPCDPTPHGPAVQFVASRTELRPVSEGAWTRFEFA